MKPSITRWLGLVCACCTLSSFVALACGVPDFEFPPEEPPGGAGASAGSNDCSDGLADCDRNADNACEINLRADLENCGNCGNACSLPHATAECSAGECRIATDGCAAGYADCNGRPEDGCEVDLDQNKDNCGACNKACPSVNGAPYCAGATCQITCEAGFADCDGRPENGCEKSTATDAANCGECDNVCPTPNGGTAYCKNEECGETVCPPGFGDCDGDDQHSCETSLETDVNSCGRCGGICVAANGTPVCDAGACGVSSCAEGFADCGAEDDGCETDTRTSTAHCGACDTPCRIEHGTPQCDAGSCEVSTCSGTFRDCNGNPDDGCEVNIATATKSCGGCGALGSDCSLKYPNASSECDSSACTAPVCNAGRENCSGGLADGCETDTSGDEQNCGGCDISCSVAATAHVNSNQCVASACTPDCKGSYLDCDDDPSNGCETDPASTDAHCGGCNLACQKGAAAHVVSNSCSASTCHPTCSGLWRDCDSTPANGCERDVSSDPNHCGGCTTVCGTLNADSTGCGAGVCTPQCKAGWGSCETPTMGCVTPLGTVDNCTACGQKCTGATPLCDPGGCVAYRTIEVGATASAIAGWLGAGSDDDVVVEHTLSFPKGSDRLVLVGTSSSDPLLDAISVQYDGFTMSYAASQADSTTTPQSWAAVYYILDKDLPEAGIAHQVVAKFWQGGQWGHAGINVLELKNVRQEKPFAWNGAAGADCGQMTVSRGVTVEFAATGSLVYAVMAGRGGTSVGGLAVPSGPTLVWYQHQADPNNHVGAAAWIRGDTNRTINFTLANCFNSAVQGVAVHRIGN